MKTINILLITLSLFLFSCNQSELNSNVKQPSFINNLLQKKLKITDTLKRYIYGIKLQEASNIVERDIW